MIRIGAEEQGRYDGEGEPFATMAQHGTAIATMAQRGTVRVKVAPLEAWTSTALRCSLCTRPMRLGSPVLAVSQSAAGAADEWTRHAHLIPSQCVAGGALAVGSLDEDCSCDVCGEGMQAEAVAIAIREEGPTMHLKCACLLAGEEIRRAEASTQREMPKPRSQVSDHCHASPPSH